MELAGVEPAYLTVSTFEVSVKAEPINPILRLIKIAPPGNSEKTLAGLLMRENISQMIPM